MCSERVARHFWADIVGLMMWWLLMLFTRKAARPTKRRQGLPTGITFLYLALKRPPHPQGCPFAATEGHGTRAATCDNTLYRVHPILIKMVNICALGTGVWPLVPLLASVAKSMKRVCKRAPSGLSTSAQISTVLPPPFCLSSVRWDQKAQMCHI